MGNRLTILLVLFFMAVVVLASAYDPYPELARENRELRRMYNFRVVEAPRLCQHLDQTVQRLPHMAAVSEQVVSDLERSSASE